MPFLIKNFFQQLEFALWGSLRSPPPSSFHMSYAFPLLREEEGWKALTGTELHYHFFPFFFLSFPILYDTPKPHPVEEKRK